MKESFFSLNRIVIISIIFVSLIISILRIEANQSYSSKITELTDVTLFQEEVQISNVEKPISINSNSNDSNTTSAIDIPYYPIIITLYFVGQLVFISLLIRQFSQTLKLIRKAEILMTIHNTNISVLSENTVPFSFFNKIFIPDKLNEDELNIILAHEMAHIKLHHSFDVIIKIIALIFFWYNPFIWLWSRSLQDIHEFQADNETLRFNPDKSIYLKLLLKYSLNIKPKFATNMLNKSSIKKRFKMITSKKSSKISLVKYSILIPIITVLLIVISCNTSKDKFNLNDTVPYSKLTVTPKFIESSEGWTDFIEKNSQLPNKASKNGIKSAYIIVSYNISKEGNIEDVEVVKSRINQGEWQTNVGYGTEEKAKNIVSHLPRHSPAELNKKKVKVNMRMPIFLGDKSEYDGYKPPTMMLIDKNEPFSILYNSLDSNTEIPSYPVLTGNSIINILTNMEYPEKAQANKEEATIKVELDVLPDGSIKNINATSKVNDYGMMQVVIDGISKVKKLDIINNENTSKSGGKISFLILFINSDEVMKDYWKRSINY